VRQIGAESPAARRRGSAFCVPLIEKMSTLNAPEDEMKGPLFTIITGAQRAIRRRSAAREIDN